MTFKYRLKYSADEEPTTAPLFAEKPDVGDEEEPTTTKEETKTPTTEGKDTTEPSFDLGDMGGGDMGSGSEPTAPTTAPVVDPQKSKQEKLDNDAKDSIKKEIVTIKKIKEIIDPEEIIEELIDANWSEERLRIELFPEEGQLEEFIKNACLNRRQKRIERFLND